MDYPFISINKLPLAVNSKVGYYSKRYGHRTGIINSLTLQLKYGRLLPKAKIRVENSYQIVTVYCNNLWLLP